MLYSHDCSLTVPQQQLPPPHTSPHPPPPQTQENPPHTEQSSDHKERGGWQAQQSPWQLLQSPWTPADRRCPPSYPVYYGGQQVTPRECEAKQCVLTVSPLQGTSPSVIDMLESASQHVVNTQFLQHLHQVARRTPDASPSYPTPNFFPAYTMYPPQPPRGHLESDLPPPTPHRR